MARLSACLLSVSAVLFMAPTALAVTPPSPSLIVTDPASSAAEPASSTTPSLVGEAEPEDGIIVQGVRSLSLTGGLVSRGTPKHPTDHPAYEIAIFTNPTCQGESVTKGRADALEGAGIPVAVAEDSVTAFSAKQIDPGDPIEAHWSTCSNSLSYWEGNPPVQPGSPGAESPGDGSPGGGGNPGTPGGPAPGDGSSRPDSPRLHMDPGGRANDNAPLVAGNAPGGSTVLVFANANCSGSAVAKGAAGQLGDGFEVEVADNTTTSFSAIAVAGGRSACSAPVTYVEDSTAPRTRITMGPGVKTRKRKAVFRFTDTTDDPPGTSFLCKVDRAKWRACSSPLRLRHLRLAPHTLRVRATDLAGNAESKGVKRRFKVIRHP